MKQLTYEQAVAVDEGGEWKNWTDDEIVRFQLYQERLCMDFSVFHRAIEAVLERPVWTHEFGFVDNLRAEYEKRKPAPTFEEIISLIPPEKLILIGID